MKNTILGYSQKVANELDLSVEDLLLLRYFIDFKETGKMVKEYNQSINDMSYWLSYDKVIEDLPIIFKGTERGNKEKLRRMFNGSLSKVIGRKDKKIKSGGTMIYIFIIPEVYSRLLNGESINENSISDEQPTTQKCVVPTTQKCGVLRLHKNVGSNISINNKSIINISSSCLETAKTDTKDDEEINNIYKFAKDNNFKIQRPTIKNLLLAYKESDIIKAITMCLDREDIKSPTAYLKTVLKDITTNKTVINNINVDGKQAQNTTSNYTSNNSKRFNNIVTSEYSKTNAKLIEEIEDLAY